MTVKYPNDTAVEETAAPVKKRGRKAAAEKEQAVETKEETVETKEG